MVAISLKKAFSSICLLYIFIIPCLSAASKPNIVLFFTDDQGYNDVGCFGSKDIKTLQKAKFTKITAAGVVESHSHDIAITREAPNYSR